MKPAPFTMHQPGSLGEAGDLLSHLSEARVIAGGQSLVPMMAMRLSRPAHLIDLGGIASLRGVSSGDGRLTIGAMTTQTQLARSDGVGPLRSAVRLIAHTQIRNRGTIGGSLAHADPAAELPATLVALAGDVVARGPLGDRSIAADDLFTGPWSTSLADDEILTEVRVPWGLASVFGIAEVARRSGDFAMVGAAVAASIEVALPSEVDRLVVRTARVVLFGVGSTPRRSLSAESALVGVQLTDVSALRAAAAAASDVEPMADVHASADYRRAVIPVVVERALAMAAGRGTTGP